MTDLRNGTVLAQQPPPPPPDVAAFARSFRSLTGVVEQTVHGQADHVALAATCLLAEGHLLIEDVPGVGKTSLATALAAAFGGRFRRIQFTADLLPGDITGVTVYDQRRNEFTLHKGPVFANVVLADEINRASPKTQSALLEVMGEQQVTIDGIRHRLEPPFLVVATQNPVDHDGTYPLPEAQLDRFLMRLELGYPDHGAERQILAGHRGGAATRPRPVTALTPEQVRDMAATARSVHVDDQVADYMIRIAAATRAAAQTRLGVSPRGTVALQRAAQVWAAAYGREFVIPDDVVALAPWVLTHRILLTADAEFAGATASGVVQAALDAVPVPRRPVRP